MVSSGAAAAWLIAGVTGLVPVTPAPAVAQAFRAPHFVGETAAGFVSVRFPKYGSMVVGFAVESRPHGILRVALLSCVTDDNCVSQTEIVPGTLKSTAGKVALSMSHPVVGRVALTAPTEYQGMGWAECRVRWWSDGDARRFAYQTNGDAYRVKWSGRIGRGTAYYDETFSCGRYQSVGVVSVTEM